MTNIDETCNDMLFLEVQPEDSGSWGCRIVEDGPGSQQTTQPSTIDVLVYGKKMTKKANIYKSVPFR